MALLGNVEREREGETKNEARTVGDLISVSCYFVKDGMALLPVPAGPGSIRQSLANPIWSPEQAVVRGYKGGGENAHFSKLPTWHLFSPQSLFCMHSTTLPSLSCFYVNLTRYKTALLIHCGNYMICHETYYKLHCHQQHIQYSRLKIIILSEKLKRG